MVSKTQLHDYITVNDFIDSVNVKLSSLSTRVIGEITEIQMYDGRSYLFFKIKDKEKPAILTCFMWKSDSALSGVKLEVGLEIIASGTPGIYKEYGRFSFNVKTVELVGEGQLKKAYDELKAKLEKEGIFSEARKRPLPILPQKIGLITSKDGAAIGDFQVNLGRYGFKVFFIDSRVEGQLAVEELMSAIRTLKNKDIEILVLIRGGGSLESLLPFNNEMLVREIVNFPAPVLVGVGHERDVSLIALASDKMVSTPTAAAQSLNYSWEKAETKVQLNENKIISIFDRVLSENQKSVESSFQFIKDQFQLIFDDFNIAEQSFLRSVVSVRSRISELHRQFGEYPFAVARGMRGLIHRTHTHVSALLNHPINQLKYAIDSMGGEINLDSVLKLFDRSISTIKKSIQSVEKIIESNNPERQLRLGYSIAKLQGKVIKSVNQIQKGQNVEVRLQDGSFESDIININKN